MKLPILDERVKWYSFSRLKSRLRQMKKSDLEYFRHKDEVWQIEQDAVLVPLDMWMHIQQELNGWKSES